MESIHEIIDFGSHIPIKFFIHSIGDVGRHWHQSVELLFVLYGQVQIFVRGQSYTLCEDDIIIINSYDIHELHADHAVLAAFQIKLSMFDANIEDFTRFRFDCNSSLSKSPEKYIPLKRLLARMIKTNAIQGDHSEVRNKALAYALLYELLSTYGTKSDENRHSENSPDMLERMGNIMDFIHHNYDQKISLSDTARRFYISQAYLSRQFKKLIGVNFYDYLTDIRLKHGVELLCTGDAPIEQIAGESGFLNSRAFVNAFKKAYGMLPSAFRKSKTKLPPTKASSFSRLDNYFDFEPSRYLAKLAGYLSEDASEPSTATSTPDIPPAAIAIDCSCKSGKLRHTWRRLVCVGKANLLLYEDMRDTLRLLQKNIGYKYIKFHGIFDDDMMVYDEDDYGNVTLSFTYVDKILDFLQSIRLRPLLQLSFMPTRLAAPGGHRIFEGKSCIAPPSDITKWNRLVGSFMVHLLERYGKAEVSHWPVCFWNEPDTSSHMFGFDNDAEYQNLYLQTYRTVKKLCPEILFGSSSYVYDTLLDMDWNESYITFCRENNCWPDFINFHFYPMVSNASDRSKTEVDYELPWNRRHLKYHESGNFMAQVLEALKQMPLYRHMADAASIHGPLNGPDRVPAIGSNHVPTIGSDRVPVYCMTEWNSTVSHRDWLSDTAWKGAYIAKNILENYDAVECFGYWTCTDLIEEQKMPGELFHGGLGMFTFNHLPKPPYHVFCMLAKLGDTLIARGDGYFVTKKEGDYIAILYNYRHYSRLYAQGELFNMTSTNRYTAFPHEDLLSLHLKFAGLDASSYILSETYVNKNHGSVFDQWLRMGAMPLDAEEMERLGALSEAMQTKRLVFTDNGALDYIVTMEPHEVRCVRLSPEYSIA